MELWVAYSSRVVEFQSTQMNMITAPPTRKRSGVGYGKKLFEEDERLELILDLNRIRNVTCICITFETKIKTRDEMDFKRNITMINYTL